MIWKLLRVPRTNETREIQALQLWEVRWSGRSGVYHMDLFPKIEAFASKQLAEDFATSLRQAFVLLDISGDGTKVVVQEAGSKTGSKKCVPTS